MPEPMQTSGSVEPTLTPAQSAGATINTAEANGEQAPAEAPPAQEGDPNVPEWLRSVDAGLQESPTLRKFHNVEALAKSYEHLQKSVGKDKYTVPDKHAAPEDWVSLFKTLGAPEDPKGYELKADEAVIQSEELEAISKGFVEAGLHPLQAEKILNWYQNYAKEQIQNFESQRATKLEESVGNLKKEWGVAYDKKIADAQNALKTVASEEEIAYIESSGLGNDPNLVKLFSKIHDKFLSEDDKAGKLDSNVGGSGAMTPDQANSEINKILSDPKHPYHVKSHANHKNAVAEVQRLFTMTEV